MTSSRTYTIYLISSVLILGIAGCRSQKSDGISLLDNQGFEKRMHQPGYTILDVRTPAEYESGFITGAINLNVQNDSVFKAGISSLDPKGKYLIYCRTGNRSMTAARLMKEKGFKYLFKLETGISQWEGSISKPEK